MTGAETGDLTAGGLLVSVVVPAYNASTTLQGTLDSVLAQTHRKLEVFVVDDGSEDDTAAIARRYAARDARVQVIERPNGGVARARNTALAEAQGDYVAWIDADDLWHPEKIARQLRVFQAAKQPLAFVYTGYRLIDENDIVTPNLRPLTEVAGNTLCRQIATNFFSNASSIMVPRPLATRLGGHDPLLRDEGVEGAEDLLMQLRLAAVGPVGYCRAALVGYRMHAANMSRGYRRAAFSNLRAISLVGDENPQVPDWVIRLGRARVIGYVGYCIAEGRMGDGLNIALHLLRQQPGETLAMALRICRLAIRKALLAPRVTDPSIGSRYADADPDTAPWRKHMLLTHRQKVRLDRADAALAPVAPSGAGPMADQECN